MLSFALLILVAIPIATILQLTRGRLKSGRAWTIWAICIAFFTGAAIVAAAMASWLNPNYFLPSAVACYMLFLLIALAIAYLVDRSQPDNQEQ